jgi:hypothetical protein
MITFSKIGTYGRFGNQMFQYATLLAIAKSKGYDYGVPYQHKSSNEFFDFCLPEAFCNLSAKDSSDIVVPNKAIERGFPYSSGFFGIQDNTDICGYFQTEKYFKDYKNDILKEYTFKKDILEKAHDMRDLTKKDAISIHLRLGDYLHLQHVYPICSLEYYQEALTKLPDDILIFVFSDEPEKAETYFKSFNRKMVFSDGTDKYVDMATMSLCDYHVIANSSFSWWGAWLSNSKKTIAPSRWFGSAPNAPKDWRDIYCKEWEII